MRASCETSLATSLGTLIIRADKEGIVEMRFNSGSAKGSNISPALRNAVTQLRAYFTGTRRTFRLRLHPDGTAFQRSVWKALLRIPYGATVTYGELARMMGKPKSVRAVARAVAANPLLIVTPCHRVVPVTGGSGNYSGGKARKRALLALERRHH